MADEQQVTPEIIRAAAIRDGLDLSDTSDLAKEAFTIFERGYKKKVAEINARRRAEREEAERL